VTIYSESNSYEAFDIFTTDIIQQQCGRCNISVSLDTPLADIWGALSTANVSILFTSSFSYVPALVNTNTVVYTDFWHRPLETWEWNRTAVEMKELVRQACQIIPPHHQRNIWQRKGPAFLRKYLLPWR